MLFKSFSLLLAPSLVLAQYGGSPPDTPSSSSSAAAVAQTSAAAVPVVHVVTVGANDQLVFVPNVITAAVGEKVEFNFFGPSHTVVEGSFDNPCQPLSATSFYSGIISTTGSNVNVSHSLSSPQPNSLPLTLSPKANDLHRYHQRHQPDLFLLRNPHPLSSGHGRRHQPISVRSPSFHPSFAPPFLASTFHSSQLTLPQIQHLASHCPLRRRRRQNQQQRHRTPTARRHSGSRRRRLLVHRHLGRRLAIKNGRRRYRQVPDWLDGRPGRWRCGLWGCYLDGLETELAVGKGEV